MGDCARSAVKIYQKKWKITERITLGIMERRMMPHEIAC